MSEGERTRSYYGQPIIKAPVWTWEIPCYLYTGGLGGASASLALVAHVRGDDVLARRAWASALIGVALSPPLLIADLGRPLRFLKMLRMFKLTSPMSVGSWILAGSGTMTALAAVDAWTGRLPRAATIARPAAALLGLPLSTYTAALLANTAVPAWHEARRELPFVFASSAALSAGAACVIAAPVAHAGPARRLALAGAALELGLQQLMERRLGEHSKAFREPPARRLGQLSRLCLTTGSGLLAVRGGRSRAAAALAGALLSAGALSARWSVFKAGFNSASDPSYVVGPQRRRIDRGQRPGAARTRPTVLNSDPMHGSPAEPAH